MTGPFASPRGFYPGWRARINGSKVSLTRSGEILQQVKLVEGKQQVAALIIPAILPA